MIVDSGKWMTVLSGVDRGSVGLIISGGLKMEDIKWVKLYSHGGVKVETKSGGTYNLALRKGWRWENGLIEF